LEETSGYHLVQLFSESMIQPSGAWVFKHYHLHYGGTTVRALQNQGEE